MKILAKIKRKSVLIGILFVLFIIGIVYAADSYQVNSGAQVTIDEHTVCKKVTNNNSLAIFVPTKTAAEWAAFRSYASGVTYVNCGWDITTATYDSKYFDTGSNCRMPHDVWFNPDGSMMYVLGYCFLDGQDSRVYQYSLSTSWDINTASYTGKNIYIDSEVDRPYGMSFKSDGSKMYVIDKTAGDIYQYSLSEAWDLATASYDSISASVSSQTTSPTGMFFKSDGTKLYIAGYPTKYYVYQYSLSTAWNLSTISYDNKYFDVGSQNAYYYDVDFNPDGSQMFIVGTTNDRAYQYLLSTPWDVSTATYNDKSFYVGDQTTFPIGMFMKTDGSKMYISSYKNSPTGNRIYQYSL